MTATTVSNAGELAEAIGAGASEIIAIEALGAGSERTSIQVTFPTV